MTLQGITTPAPFGKPLPRLRVVKTEEPKSLAAIITPEAKRAFLELEAEFNRLAPAFGTYTTPAVQANASDQALKVAAAAMKVWESLR